MSKPQPNLFALEAPEPIDLMVARRSMPATVRRVVEASGSIQQDPPERADFLHSVLCQVGMPRKKTEGRTFERESGTVSIMLEAGRLWNGRKFVEQPLPYGTRPRLVMVHLSSEAIRTQSRTIEIGESMRDFLLKLDIDPTGGQRGNYTMFRKQMESLAACRLTLGMTNGARAITVDAKPIKKFEAWVTFDGRQRSLWPGELELSEEFFETLALHAVPLDHRALGALKHSALALDIYTWLAHRLCRIKKAEGIKLSWSNLRDQFGQEYRDPKNFKKEFRQALRQVLAVYPDARIEDAAGGLIMRPSKPPLPKACVPVHF
jgi:replication initiator protein